MLPSTNHHVCAEPWAMPFFISIIHVQEYTSSSDTVTVQKGYVRTITRRNFCHEEYTRSETTATTYYFVFLGLGVVILMMMMMMIDITSN